MRQRKRGENAILAYSLPIIAIQDRNESGEYPRKQNEIDVGIRQMARADQIIQNREQRGDGQQRAAAPSPDFPNDRRR